MTITTPDIVRPDKSLIEGLRHIGAATAAGELSRLGIRNAHMLGDTVAHDNILNAISTELANSTSAKIPRLTEAALRMLEEAFTPLSPSSITARRQWMIAYIIQGLIHSRFQSKAPLECMNTIHSAIHERLRAITVHIRMSAHA